MKGVKKSRRSTNDTEQALALMFEVGRIIRKAWLERAQLPVPLSYIETVRFVGERKNPSMRDVADYLRIAAPSATAFVEALAADGYLVRKADPADRRLVRLSLSAKGKQLLAEKNRLHSAAVRSIIGSLGAADRRELVRILSIVVKK